MKALLNSVCDVLAKAASTVIGLLIGAIVVITLAAVWWRYVLNAPLAWPEQISRIFFVWVTFLGAAVLYRQKLHITIDMIVLMLPERAREALAWLTEIAILAFLVILFVYGLKLSLDTWDNTFGALDITPASFYLAAPVASAMMILFFVEKIFDPSKRQPSGTAHTL